MTSDGVLAVATFLKDQALLADGPSAGLHVGCLTVQLNSIASFFANVLMPALLSFAIDLQLRPPSYIGGVLESVLRVQTMLQAINATQGLSSDEAAVVSNDKMLIDATQKVAASAERLGAVHSLHHLCVLGERLRLTLITYLLSHSTAPQVGSLAAPNLIDMIAGTCRNLGPQCHIAPQFLQ
jgi:hypothetical protein